MKAVVAAKYGPPEVLQIKEIDKPAPASNEILVKVRATTVTAGDSRMRAFNVPPAFWLPARLALGLTRPRRPIYGMELAGDVEAVGPEVTRFNVGDAVFASTLAAGFGGHAAYKCLPEDGIVATKPANVSYEDAAALPVGATTALRLLRKGNIQRGQKVLIYGASGSVGTYAIQLALHFGAEVTGVCGTANVEMVKSLGAHAVLDYTKDDPATRPERYDVIYDTVAKSGKSISQALAPGGVFVSILKLSSKEELEQLTVIRDLAQAGKIKAVVDRRYPMEQIVEAHRYVDAGHKRGNVIVTVP